MKLSATQARAVATQTVQAINEAKTAYLKSRLSEILKEEIAEHKRLKKESDVIDAKIDALKEKIRKKFPSANTYNSEITFDDYDGQRNFLSDVNDTYMKLMMDSIKSTEFDYKSFIADAVKSAIAELKKAY